MKSWEKGAIIGIVWGLVSGLSWLLMIGGPLPSIWAKTVFFPGYFTFMFFGAIGGILQEKINLLPRLLYKFLNFLGLVLPVVVGALIGIIIIQIINKIGVKLK